jgi:hypothetical protein
MMLNLPIKNWENFSCDMSFPHVNYSYLLTGNENKQNEEFILALENSIKEIYKKSYVFKYYNVDVNCENGVVFFYNLSKKSIFKSNKFIVKLKIPNKTKSFFKGDHWWDATFGPEWPEWVPAEKLSQIKNGTLSNSITTTKSHSFSPPFSISFRTQGVEQNYLIFNRFFSPNLEDTILVSLDYDVSSNRLYPIFDPQLILPYKEGLTLSQDLEFKILDSTGKHVEISDNSQLFIIITLL